MYNIAMVGDSDSIIGFKLLGISLFPISNKEETIEILNKLVKDKFAVIFITEEIAIQIFEKIEELQKNNFPSIVIIPNKYENKNLGLKILKKNIEKAIGKDILFIKGEK
jgi:V/A-type H+-transporting ATPase subunit F